MTVPTWFLYVAGFSLVLLGILQIQARPRSRTDTLYQRFVNLGTVWSLLCITVGVGILAMALGYWAPEMLAHPPQKPQKAQKR